MKGIQFERQIAGDDGEGGCDGDRVDDDSRFGGYGIRHSAGDIRKELCPISVCRESEVAGDLPKFLG